jgi:hypothetical protein
MLVETTTCLVEVHLGQGRVVGPTGRHHHVVDRIPQSREEALQGGQVVRVERRGAPRTDLGGGALQPVAVAAGQDDVGPLGPRTPRRLQPDPGAPTDHDHGLSPQSRLWCRLHAGHGVAVGRVAPTGACAAAISSRSDFSAPT